MAQRNRWKEAHNNERLDRLLTDYSAIASGAAKVAHRRVGNWPVYAAAAGSALAMATNASASIIYCGSSNNYCEPASQHPNPSATAQGAEVNIPLLGTSAHQIVLEVGTGQNSAFGFFGNASVFGGKVKFFGSTSASSNFFAKNFMAGAMIGPSIGSQSAVLRAQGLINLAFSSGASTFGNFKPGVTGIAGFAISDVGSLNQTDYGWMRLVFTDNANGTPQILTAIDWAIETDGGAIAAPTPEPGTMALGLLATGAFGVAALRRRRKQAQAL